ncbi:cell division protein PerM [Leifsonia poae]|uniref:cell division protein PerM n=1 Tax=Leifsonia poae TaxID=110933 RepID=UPI001CC07B8F|nr:DUF6350 family protein [Leifsonia poae]
MNRTTVALLAALEAVIVVAVGIGLCLVPLTALWAAQYHLAGDWFAFWRASADIWLVGHGVNLTVVLDAQLGASLGLPGATVPFQITMAALGFAALTAGFGVRTGLRAAETPYRVTGAVSAVVTFAALATIVTLTAGSAPVRPSVWQGILLPPFVYALGVVCGIGFAALRARAGGASATPAGVSAGGVSNSGSSAVAGATGAPAPAGSSAASGRPAGAGSTRAGADAIGATADRGRSAGMVTVVVRRWLEAVPDGVLSGASAALRAGTAAAALVIAGAAIILAVLIIGNFGSIIGLYEQLQTGALGGAALTIGQLAVLPNLVIWLASWLVGPGFAIGTGSSVSPIGTDLGPIPGLPLFGVIPPGGFAFGLVGVLVPLIAGFLAAVLLRSRIVEARAAHGLGWLVFTALGIGVVAGSELGLLAWWSSGALGPGRLHTVGPDPWLVGSIAAAEVAVAALIALATRALTRSRPRR